MKAFFRALRCITKWVPRRQAGLLRNLNDIKVPSAVVCGEKDVLFPAETAARMAKMMPTSKYTMIPNVRLPNVMLPNVMLAHAKSAAYMLRVSRCPCLTRPLSMCSPLFYSAGIMCSRRSLTRLRMRSWS